MSEISVLQVANGLGVGGAQKCLEVAARNLDAERFTSAICGLHEGGERGDALERDGYDVFTATDVSELTAELERRDIDLMHIFGRGPGELPVSAAREAGVDAIVKTTNFGWTDRPDIARDVDVYLFQSKTMLLRYLLVNNFRLDSESWHARHKVLYNPIVIDEVSTEEGYDYRDELGLDPTVPVAGKIGRPAGAKWGKITIRGFARIRDRLPEARLVLVTPPESIRAEVERLGLEDVTHYLDTVPPDEVSRFYNTVDVLTHSSAIGEAFGNVLAESLAHRTPIVVDSDPIRDNGQLELVENGVTGYVANNPKAYADATEELLTDDELNRQFGDAGREKIESRYRSERYVDRLQQVYVEALSDDGAEPSEGRAAVIPDAGTDIADFSREYHQMLDDHYGAPGWRYRLEKSAWKVAANVPVPQYHEEFYKGIRLALTRTVLD